MEQKTTHQFLWQIMNRVPDAQASIHGSSQFPAIHGTVSFWQTAKGTLTAAEIHGLPHQEDVPCDHPVFALHIHEGDQCTGNEQDPFANAKGHYNPEGCEHPFHAGDLPPLLSNKGEAWSAVLTDRFAVPSVVGRVVIIHRQPDDFKTQPSGNAGAKIACGVIRSPWL